MIVEWTKAEPPHVIRYINDAFTRHLGYQVAEAYWKKPSGPLGRSRYGSERLV